MHYLLYGQMRRMGLIGLERIPGFENGNENKVVRALRMELVAAGFHLEKSGYLALHGAEIIDQFRNAMLIFILDSIHNNVSYNFQRLRFVPLYHIL